MPESKQANGNILPACFVMLDTTKDGCVIQATAGAKIYGIAQVESRMFPFPGLDDGYAAIAGENLKVFTPADKDVWLQVGAGGCAPGDRLKATTNGVGILTVTNLDEWGAIAKETGLSGDLVRVDPVYMAQISS